jgi:sulfite exporter TauE/SafE
MELWTAFFLGLVGSLHCAGMCGPIALAVPPNLSSTWQFVLGRLAYNFGRITTYCLMGAVFGLIGKSLVVIGWQRWISLIAGTLILAALLINLRISLSASASKPIGFLKLWLGKFLRGSSLTTTFCLGALNGFLPCGLVYAACASAGATGAPAHGVEFMAVFGMGTIPMMLGIGLAGKKLQLSLRFKLQKLIPATLVVVSLLLIFRGLALGIPYLSPDPAYGSCCHH